MKKIADMKVVQIYLFKPDTLPYAHFSNKVFIDAIRDKFSFQSYNPLVVQQGIGPGYDFLNGVLTTSSVNVPFEQFRVVPIKLSFVVVGDSSTAKLAYEEIVGAIKNFVPSFDPDILEMGKQTSCAVDLNIDFSSLFNPK